MLDLERNQLKSIVDLTVLCRRHCAGPERAEEGVRTRCLEKKDYGAAILPRGVFELWARIRGHRLVTSNIRAVDTFLSSMKHHQVLCVLSACCLCLVCMSFKAYLGRDPLETRNP